MNNSKILQKIRSIFSWEYMPVCIYMLFIIMYHLKYQATGDDVALIADTLKDSVWEEFSSVIYNFNSWSSRVLVNLPIHILLHFDYKVWMIIELLMFVIIFKSLSFIFIRQNKLNNEYVLTGLLLLFPLDYAKTAGWITSTMTYIWPLAIGIFASTSIKKAYEGHKFKWYEYLMYIPAIIYGANQEQLSVVFTIMFVVNAFFLIKDNKTSVLIIIQAGFAIANLFFHMFTPGNSNRSIIEAKTRFPDYGTLSLIDKLELGFSSSLAEFFLKCNLFSLAFFVIIAVLVWVKTNNKFFRFIGVAPLLSQIFFGCICNYIVERKLLIGIFDNRQHIIGTIDESNYYRWVSYYTIFCIFAVSIALIATLYIIFGNTKKSVISIALLFAGLGARMVVAFSPSIWESSVRTYTVTYFVFISLGAMLANTLDYKALGKRKNLLFTVIFVILLGRFV